MITAFILWICLRMLSIEDDTYEQEQLKLAEGVDNGK